MSPIHLNSLDLTIFIAYLFLAVGFGFLVSVGRKKTTRGYFLGGKSLPWFVIATSMLASDVSSEHFIASAGNGYTYGIVSATQSWNAWIIYSIFIAIFLPYYVRTNLYTIPEFLERRYSPSCRYIFSASLLAGYVGALIAGTLYAGGLVFQRLLGSYVTSGFLGDGYHQIVVGIFFFAFLTGTYTIYGGLRSAAWTDFMQIVVLAFGGILVPILGIIALQKFGGITALAHENPEKFQIFLPVTHPKFPFTGVFTGFLTVGIWYTCTSQHMVQRVLAAKDEWHARMGVIGAGFLHIVTPFFFVFPGVIGYKLVPHLSRPDLIYLTLVERLVWPGLRGLILAAMGAALMSNLSAVLNSSSTLITIDFYKKLINPNADDDQQVRFGRIGGVIILAAGSIIAWSFSLTPTPLFIKIQNIFFFIAPPFSVIFCAGLLWRRANTIGALTTIVAGFLFSAYYDYLIVHLFGGQQGVYLHRAFFTWCFCVLVMATVSYFTAPQPEEQVAPILWSPKYARLPAALREHYSGLKDYRIWWLLFVGCVLAIYAFFIWFRFQHPEPMF
ncbi:MAG TPA: sodium/solute symporter [Tepidisphaeraceae bacterium]|jgi:SSS family solute:Na+ symporter